VHVKRTVRKERFFSMLEMDAGVLPGSFKGRSTERLQHAAVQMKVHVVISSTKNKEEDRAQDGFSDKAIIVCR
jgi:hypothetical protein